jgi:predicted aspartyl protease
MSEQFLYDLIDEPTNLYQPSPNIKELGKQAMGKIMQKTIVINAGDLYAVKSGLMPAHIVRQIEVNFLVDTGAAMLCLPLRFIKELGLIEERIQKVQTANGLTERRIFSSVKVVIFDRQADMNVMEMPDDGTPALLGYLPLEMLDLYPNPKKQILEGNPAADGKMIIDLF